MDEIKTIEQREPNGHVSTSRARAEFVPGRTIGELLSDMVGNLEEILRSEVKLAKIEMKEEATKAWLAFRPLLAGAVLAMYGLGFGLLCAVYALALVLPSWAAALCVAVALALSAAVLISAGRKRLKLVDVAPRKSIDTMRENVEWIRNRTK
jgi:uncharacterized membrane protein YqjE